MEIIFDEDTGLWEKKKEAYTTVEIATEKDYKRFCEMVERNIAKEPQAVDYKGRNNGNKHKYICPNCDYTLKWAGGINRDEFLCKYCPECGQKIDWSELEK